MRKLQSQHYWCYPKTIFFLFLCNFSFYSGLLFCQLISLMVSSFLPMKTMSATTDSSLSWNNFKSSAIFCNYVHCYAKKDISSCHRQQSLRAIKTISPESVFWCINKPPIYLRGMCMCVYILPSIHPSTNCQLWGGKKDVTPPKNLFI